MQGKCMKVGFCRMKWKAVTRGIKNDTRKVGGKRKKLYICHRNQQRKL